MQRWIGQMFFFFLSALQLCKLSFKFKKKSLYTLNQIIKIWLKL